MFVGCETMQKCDRLIRMNEMSLCKSEGQQCCRCQQGSAKVRLIKSCKPFYKLLHQMCLIITHIQSHQKFIIISQIFTPCNHVAWMLWKKNTKLNYFLVTFTAFVGQLSLVIATSRNQHHKKLFAIAWKIQKNPSSRLVIVEGMIVECSA